MAWGKKIGLYTLSYLDWPKVIQQSRSDVAETDGAPTRRPGKWRLLHRHSITVSRKLSSITHWKTFINHRARKLSSVTKGFRRRHRRREGKRSPGRKEQWGRNLFVTWL